MFNNGQNITGLVNEINVVVPSGGKNNTVTTETPSTPKPPDQGQRPNGAKSN
jgi:hypothetical protein